MMQIFQKLTAPVVEQDLLLRLRQRYLETLLLTTLLLIGLVTVIDLLRGTMSDDNYVLLAAGLLAFALLLVNRVGYTSLAGGMLIVTLLAATLYYTDIRGLVPAIVAIITAAALLKRPWFVLAVVLTIGYRVWLVSGRLLEGIQGGVDLPLWIDLGPVLTMLFVALTIRYFIRALERLVRRTERAAGLLAATNEIGQITISLTDLNTLFSRAVEAIQERFGFYHVQIFMINGNQAELVASTGEAGKRLLANKHRLPVGSNSVIGYVTRYGEPVIARSSDAVHRFNPLLPDTRSELAVPIMDGSRIVGAVDMQSVDIDAFQPEDVQALQSLANLLAATIRNASLFEEQQRSLQEQQRLYRESDASLREIQRLNRQLTRAGWEDFLRQGQQTGGVTLDHDRLLPNAQWTEYLTEAARTRQVVTRPANGSPGVVAVPVIVRGEVIGAIEVEPGEDGLEQEAAEMVQAVAQRLAASLENARLFEEAQAATAQEQRINQIVTRYQSATKVDDLLQITLTELSEALGAQRGAIRLGILPADQNQNGASA
jgi:GAF domain-containing protein/uncharacterized membrane protein YhdT